MGLVDGLGFSLALEIGFFILSFTTPVVTEEGDVVNINNGIAKCDQYIPAKKSDLSFKENDQDLISLKTVLRMSSMSMNVYNHF